MVTFYLCVGDSVLYAVFFPRRPTGKCLRENDGHYPASCPPVVPQPVSICSCPIFLSLLLGSKLHEDRSSPSPPVPQPPYRRVCHVATPLTSGSDLRATCLPCARQGPDGGRSAEWAPPSAKPASPARPLVQAPTPGVCVARPFYSSWARPALLFLRQRQARGPDSGRFQGLRGHGPPRQEDVNSCFV